MFSLSRIIGTVPLWLAALTFFCATTALVPDSARAQTATKLNCKKCVKNRHVAKKTLKGNRLKNGVISLEKLESGLGERANATQPFYVFMDNDNERKDIITHGPLTLFARCVTDVTDPSTTNQEDAVELYVTSTVDGWFTSDNNGPGVSNSGPFSAGEEILTDITFSERGTGNPDTEDLDTGDGAFAPGGYFLGYSEDTLSAAFNALGHLCTFAGIVNVVKGSP